ncbi:hypothetical protein H310_10926 [Aphanomyces invadans]|uniref:Uncharacterized protein n=1 Tax=Aphanomyces invadans TaxID=157072 RepID=A0A024TPH4_9STRA|nr:hypothetical protein H310_10926 [Aphanomyces invadans]ETV95888.1 hypothetical protein H310_10926 [Aphanomyces invadans]|eukprot:XP_008875639.1 hypothetical protein H310_10926 [Aphanomyces invadans]
MQATGRDQDLQERVSYIQSATKDGDNKGYEDAKTPGELEDGALVAGGALDLFSREAIGLFTQYAAIGIIYGMIPALNYPIFNVYLQLEGYQTASYSTLVTLGWSFKVFMGMFSDCFPIFGDHDLFVHHDVFVTIVHGTLPALPWQTAHRFKQTATFATNQIWNPGHPL